MFQTEFEFALLTEALAGINERWELCLNSVKNDVVLAIFGQKLTTRKVMKKQDKTHPQPAFSFL